MTQLAKTLTSTFAELGKNITVSVNIGRSHEKEETYKLKIEMLQEEVARIIAEKGQLEQEIKNNQDKITSLSSNINETKDKQTSTNTLVDKRREKEALSLQIDGLEEKIRQEDLKEREKMNKESSLEVALAKLEGELTGISERLSLEYNLNLEDLAKTPHEVPNIAKAKKDIEEGRLLLHSLEPVNLLAIEEFDKESLRLSFIETQLADLNSARENLSNLIMELDQKAEETFVQTMDQLSIVFAETFSKLFAGGEAKIKLTPGVPALEAEVEIEVRPKGRKWLPLPLLSGGERSLSAIAILFSLLKIRPSPFVFMDEVDAALDDANIGRFAEMIKDFSLESQIIVITHNKRTMAVADNIYGVTMEEPGVSQVISMKLAETAQ
ncbi:MAG: AAA family ATPase [Candidatus Margulisbacteria bacterium]|nr:AAA family ATPase [Candidatus Margulisiibacteriota bacterium]